MFSAQSAFSRSSDALTVPPPAMSSLHASFYDSAPGLVLASAAQAARGVWLSLTEQPCATGMPDADANLQLLLHSKNLHMRVPARPICICTVNPIVDRVIGMHICRRMSEAQFWSTYFRLVARLLERPLPQTVPLAPALAPSSAAERSPEQCRSHAWSQRPSPSTMSAWEDLGGGSSGEHGAALGPPRVDDDLDEYLKVRSMACTMISC
jgi:hypothetical protein